MARGYFVAPSARGTSGSWRWQAALLLAHPPSQRTHTRAAAGLTRKDALAGVGQRRRRPAADFGKGGGLLGGRQHVPQVVVLARHGWVAGPEGWATRWAGGKLEKKQVMLTGDANRPPY